MHIGIFDSGRGGELVADKLRHLLPSHDLTVVNDIKHAPYGERSYPDIIRLTDAAIQPLLTTCPIIVLACNTATAAAIDYLRTTYPATKFIGFEPMLKPAAHGSSTKRLTLLATRATAYATRTESLINTYAANCVILRPDTSGWATAVDHDEVADIDLAEVARCVQSGSDAIIIGCTHYIALMPRIQEKFPDVTLYEPTEAVARQIKRRVAQLQR